MKVLPIKLPDEFYQQLKLTAKLEGIPMAEVIRQKLKPMLAKSLKSHFDPIAAIAKNPIKAQDRFKNLSDDELLYGRGQKLWKRTS